MKPLTPTASAVLDALRDGPATATALRVRIGCGRSTIDKALADLARGQVVTRLPDDHPEHPGQWALTDTPTGTEADSPAADATNEAADEATATGDVTTDTEQTDGDRHDEASAAPADDGTAPASAEEVKLCRGCQAQMPRICPTCWSKTTSYCGTCRQSMPARGRGSGVPEILSNGLPKLTRGQLAELVLEVMQTQPLPDHLGITGWTSGRIAIYLPGRSTGAIGNVLDKLTSTGAAELLGDSPKRYRLCTPLDATTEADPPGDAGASPSPQ